MSRTIMRVLVRRLWQVYVRGAAAATQSRRFPAGISPQSTQARRTSQGHSSWRLESHPFNNFCLGHAPVQRAEPPANGAGPKGRSACVHHGECSCAPVLQFPAPLVKFPESKVISCQTSLFTAIGQCAVESLPVLDQAKSQQHGRQSRCGIAQPLQPRQGSVARKLIIRSAFCSSFDKGLHLLFLYCEAGAMWPACPASELSGRVGRLWQKQNTDEQGLFLVVKPLAPSRCVLSAITPKGDLLALSTSSGSIFCLHLDRNRYVLLETAGRTAVAAAFMARTTRRLFVAFTDNSIACYDAAASVQVARVAGSRSAVHSLCVRAGSEQLASASAEGVALWDAYALRQQHMLQVGDQHVFCLQLPSV